MLLPTPNARSEVGMNRDAYLVDPNRREPGQLQLYRFLGELTRHVFILSLTGMTLVNMKHLIFLC